jgi:hypothetical protein
MANRSPSDKLSVMDFIGLTKKLIAVARSNPPGEQVPYGFEKRIMARLSILPKTDEWLWWGRALWRGAAACALVALLLSAWSFLPVPNHASTNGAADLEEAVLASVNEADVTW